MTCACGVQICNVCGARGCPNCAGQEADSSTAARPAVDLASEEETSPPNVDPVWAFQPELYIDTTAAGLAGPESEAAESDMRRNSAIITGDGDGCAACGLGLRGAADGTEWRICRCGLMYCAACSGSPCVACPVAAVWGDGDAASAHEAELLGEPAPAGQSQEQRAKGAKPSPDQLWADRKDKMQRRKADLHEQRHRSHEVRRQQIRDGKRPKRTRPDQGTCTFTTTNVTAVSSLMSELQFGTTLNDSHYILVQEHGARGEDRIRAENAALRNGWDIVASDAYLKNSKEGGGTAIMTKEPTGVRPLAQAPKCPEGRLSAGTIYLDGEVTIIAGYGISGAPISKQMELLKAVCETVRLMARPFVAGGDWQVSPEVMASTGIQELLNCTICAPRFGTNLISGNKIDYFIASDALLCNGWTTKVHFGSSLATHAPSSITLNRARGQEEVRRLSQPRPLPVHRTFGPCRDTTGVDWNGWQAIAEAENPQTRDANTVTHAMATWYAGAERELLELFDLDDDDDGAAFMGIGEGVQEIIEPSTRRFKDVPNRWGLVGHRLAWTSRGLHYLIRHGPALREDGHGEQSEILSRIAWRAGGLLRNWGKEHQRTTMGNNICDDGDGTHRMVLHDAKLTVTSGLSLLYSLVRGCHRKRPGLHLLWNGCGEALLEKATGTRNELEQVIRRFAEVRNRNHVKEVRRWAKSATLQSSHAATKVLQDQVRKTASAAKSHKGEKDRAAGRRQRV